MISREQKLAGIMFESLLVCSQSDGSPIEVLDEFVYLLSAVMDLRILIDRCIDYNDIETLRAKATEESIKETQQ